MAPVTVVVPSDYTGKGKRSGQRRYRPTKRLKDENNNNNWSKFEGNVLDLSEGMVTDLRPITMAPSFDRLTVLCLRGTGLIDIELLRSCSSLVYLDLSSNNVVQLVDDSFWACFPELLVLLLHENKITDWQAVGSLGAATRLTYLTLFSNPVSKKEVYRTFMTNRCESLRGLDLHAVSDEEVIEGSCFPRGSRFKACSITLTLPQTLFKALTKLNLRPMKEGGQLVEACTDCCEPNRQSTHDAGVLASVIRRVTLLRDFHARNSPVMIGQRFVRHYIRDSNAATRIQKYVRRWLIKRKTTHELAVILRDTGKLYLIQEILTPVQLRSLAKFQRHIAGKFRLKVLIKCTKSIERFMGRTNKRFAAIGACLDRAKVGGIVVSSNAVGKLVEAVSKALMTANGMSIDDSNKRAEEMVTVITTCRLIRTFSYVNFPHWPVLTEGIKTDGVFVTKSCTGGPPACIDCPDGFLPSADMTTYRHVRSISGLKEQQMTVRQGRRIGVFGNRRVKDFRVSRRGVAVRHLHREFAVKEPERVSSLGLETPDKLWIFQPVETHMLTRVLLTLRNRYNGKPPIPCILELHLFRRAAATRIQAGWRGYMLRWNLLESLVSCLIVARAGLCIQRWWRGLNGIRARLRLTRRLWALASSVRAPTMYMELDVYYVLTRGWQRGSGEDGFAFILNGGEKATRVVPRDTNTPDATENVQEANSGKINHMHRHQRDSGGSISSSTVREPPLWLEKLGVPQILESEVGKRLIFHQVGHLLIEGVETKRVMWPVGAKVATSLSPAQDPGNSCDLDVDQAPAHFVDLLESPRQDQSSEVRQALVGEPCPDRAEDGVTTGESQDLVDFESRLGGLEMLELTFSSTEEAKARALLLALATEENGVASNRPIAQLMTLDMLRRAAAGSPGKAAPLVKSPPMGYQRGDAVEVTLLKHLEGSGGDRFLGTINGTVGHGALYKVTMDNGWVESHVPENRLRPYDRTGKELALVEMSHLPSWWQRKARTSLTPVEAFELKRLRKSLRFASVTQISPLQPGRLLRNDPPRDMALLALCRADGGHLNGIAACERDLNVTGNGRALAEGLTPCPKGSTVGGDDVRTSFSSARHWAGSTKISGVKGLGGKQLTTVLTVDKAVSARSWVPGNRFKWGLEKLVQQTALESQQEKRERDLRDKKDAVAKARSAEHSELTPRVRIEIQKAKEIAEFRRETDEVQYRAALENEIGKAERANKVAMAKEEEIISKRLSKLYMEEKLEEQLADIKKSAERVEEERNKKTELWGKDVQIAMARAMQRKRGRARQAIRREECFTFTANASRLVRNVRQHETMSRKARSVNWKKLWVQRNKAEKEDLHRRLLRRVEDLQSQNRRKISQQRRILAVRVKTRAAMDKAALHHRLGQLIPPNDHLAVKIQRVLRPNCRPERRLSSPRNGLGDCIPKQTDEGIRGKGNVQRAGDVDDVEYQRRAATTGTSVGRNFPLQNGNFRPIDAVPSKPNGPRSRPHNGRNRRIHVKKPRNTVVVFASVPSVTVEARPKHSSGTNDEIHRFDGNVQLTPSVKASHGGEGSSPGASPVVTPDQRQFPWPIGRRWW